MIAKKLLFLTFLVVVIFPWSGISAKKTKKRKRIVEVNFDDELLIKGKLLGPSLFTLYQKKNIEFGKLIQPRQNFLPEMRATTGDVE